MYEDKYTHRAVEIGIKTQDLIGNILTVRFSN